MAAGPPSTPIPRTLIHVLQLQGSPARRPSSRLRVRAYPLYVEGRVFRQIQDGLYIPIPSWVCLYVRGACINVA